MTGTEKTFLHIHPYYTRFESNGEENLKANSIGNGIYVRLHNQNFHCHREESTIILSADESSHSVRKRTTGPAMYV